MNFLETRDIMPSSMALRALAAALISVYIMPLGFTKEGGRAPRNDAQSLQVGENRRMAKTRIG